MALSRVRVVAEASRLLDDEGLEALSLRTLAARLGVRAPTLYWYVKNKSELLDAVADAIMDEAIAAVPEPSGDDGRVWLLDALAALRVALLGHRDGARVVSGARYSLRRADFSELAMATLVGYGHPAHEARLLVLAGERYTVGWVLEEQGPAPDGPAPDPDMLRARFPVMTRAIGDYFTGTGRTPLDLYLDAGRQVLGIAGT